MTASSNRSSLFRLNNISPSNSVMKIGNVRWNSVRTMCIRVFVRVHSALVRWVAAWASEPAGHSCTIYLWPILRMSMRWPTLLVLKENTYISAYKSWDFVCKNPLGNGSRVGVYTRHFGWLSTGCLDSGSILFRLLNYSCI